MLEETSSSEHPIEPSDITDKRMISEKKLKWIKSVIDEWNMRLQYGGLSSAKPQEAAPKHTRNSKIKRPFRRPPVYDVIDDLADLQEYYEFALHNRVDLETYTEIMQTYSRLRGRLR